MDIREGRTIPIIAEIGQSHDGSLGILHSLIDAISGAGGQVIKFQMHYADVESSEHDQFRVSFSRVDRTRQDYWRRMELTPKQWLEIKEHCESLGCEFLCTPFSVHAVRVLEEIGVKRYKVGSGDISNHLLLEAIRRTGKPVILSSGMSNYDELDVAVKIFADSKTHVSILQCTSQYPAPPSRWGLNLISEIRDRYLVPVGLSDHSGSIYPGLSAAALGAELLEVHVTFDRRMFGPDASSSLEIAELSQLVQGVRAIKEAIDNPVDKSDLSDVEQMRALFGRSLVVAEDIHKGDRITFELLEAAKPLGFGVSPDRYSDLIGRKSKRDLKKGSFLLEEDLE